MFDIKKLASNKLFDINKILKINFDVEYKNNAYIIKHNNGQSIFNDFLSAKNFIDNNYSC